MHEARTKEEKKIFKLIDKGGRVSSQPESFMTLKLMSILRMMKEIEYIAMDKICVGIKIRFQFSLDSISKPLFYLIHLVLFYARE